MESEENLMTSTGILLSIGGLALSGAGALITGIADRREKSEEIKEVAEKVAKEIVEQMNKESK
jgi:homoserine kinase